MRRQAAAWSRDTKEYHVRGTLNPRFIKSALRWLSLGLFVFLIACSDASDSEAAKQARLKELCDKYARIYVAENFPNWEGYLNKGVLGAPGAAIANDLLFERYVYKDKRIRKGMRMYVSDFGPHKEKRDIEFVGESGVYRITLGGLNDEFCVYPASYGVSDYDLGRLSKERKEELGDLCILAIPISLDDVEYSFEHFQEKIQGEKGAWYFGSRFREGYDGKVLVDFTNVGWRDSSGKYQCFNYPQGHAMTIALKERLKRYEQ